MNLLGELMCVPRHTVTINYMKPSLEKHVQRRQQMILTHSSSGNKTTTFSHSLAPFVTFLVVSVYVRGGGGGDRYCQVSFVYKNKTFDDPGRESDTKKRHKKRCKKGGKEKNQWKRERERERERVRVRERNREEEYRKGQDQHNFLQVMMTWS